MTKYNESERCVYFDMTDVSMYMRKKGIEKLNTIEMEEMFYEIALAEVVDRNGNCKLISDDDYSIAWISELREDAELREEFDGFMSDHKVPMTLSQYLEHFGLGADYSLLFDRQRRIFTVYNNQSFAEMIGLDFCVVPDSDKV